ncbi:helix-turn-helix domain-containing protein [Dehalobacter sp. TeCB1]|jgi:excisionase family DNA binding protein|uniref:helix-turn-helix transcriptional regulator n=1 Tax=Dehalobacter sp. TeCB1 TaxID=1843715 RepID=UPI00083B1B3B|nr:helix-turn-helix domain-containing protein [Dehalobacter sp. TeCB1]OCZ52187.1 hypothetical protein A7D23_11275 [Dehalobacter sp. TeCB1]
MNETYYTVTEVAEILKVKKAYIYDLINFGKLKSIKLSERRTRVSLTDFNNYLLQTEENLGYNKVVQAPCKRGQKFNAKC